MPFNVRKIGEKYFVSTDFGGWALLEKREYNLLRTHRVHIDPELFEKLLACGIVATSAEYIMERMRRRYWYFTNGTSLHVIATTNRCNFRCDYCYANPSQPMDMDKETARKVADFILQSPAPIIVAEFSGGEPLLNFDAVKEIIERLRTKAKAKKKRIGFSIVHNGTAWDEDKAEYMMRRGVGICFSIDGPEDLHNLHRRYAGGQGTYRDVVKWVKWFREQGYPRLHAIPVITRDSLKRWKDIADEYLKLGFRTLRFKYLGYFGRARDNWSALSYSPAQFLEAWKNVVNYGLKLTKDGIFFREDLTSILVERLFSFEDPGFCEIEMPCGAGINQLAYGPDGSIYTCDEGRLFEEFKIGTVEMGYGEVLRNEVLKNMIVASSGYFSRCAGCAFRPFCGNCPVESFAMGGNLFENRRRCEIYAGMLEFLIKKIEEDDDSRRILLSWGKARKGELHAIGFY